MAEFFRLSTARDLDVDLGSGHTAYRHASLVDLYHQISLKSKKLFVDGRTDVRTGGRTFETHFIRPTRRSRPKNVSVSHVWFCEAQTFRLCTAFVLHWRRTCVVGQIAMHGGRAETLAVMKSRSLS